MTEYDLRPPEQLTRDELLKRVESLEIKCRVADGKLQDAREYLVRALDVVHSGVEYGSHQIPATSLARTLKRAWNCLYPAEKRKEP